MSEIESVHIDDVGNGNRVYFETTYNDEKCFLFVDIGGNDALRNVEIPEGSKVSVIITHGHNDHISQLDNLIEKSVAGDVKLEAVYMDFSVLKTDTVAKILNTDNKIMMDDLSSENEEDVKEILAYIYVLNGEKASDEFLREYKKQHPKSKLTQATVNARYKELQT